VVWLLMDGVKMLALFVIAVVGFRCVSACVMFICGVVGVAMCMS
jgi:hypothetical protein